MAEGTSEAALHNEETKKKNVLEEKSKEELIKIVAKQLNLLKKVKGKSDELSKRCQDLEEEKQTALNKQSATIIELQLHIEKLEKDYCDLSEKNKKIVEEQNKELVQLKALLKPLESEKNAVSSLLNEKEEQIQCLTMQLNTVKETCQFLQSDLVKIKTENQEYKTENHVLTEARNSTVESLKSLTFNADSKSKECENLIKEIRDLNDKFEVCKKENVSLVSKIENLTNQIETLQIEKSDLFLKLSKNESSAKSIPVYPIDDLTYLVKENQNLLSENSALKERLQQLEGGSLHIDADKTILDHELFFKTKKENEELIQNVFKLGTTNTTLINEKETLEEKNHDLSEELKQMKSVKLKLDNELSVCLKENENLNEEIKRLARSLQENEEFKSGFEHALLYGAGSEHIDQSPFLNSSAKTVPPTTSEIAEVVSVEPEPSQMRENANLPIIDDSEMMSGIEFGLLGGGNITESYENLVDDSKNEQMILQKCKFDVTLIEKLQAENDRLIEQVNSSIKKNDEFASLLQETMRENESLKLKLDSVENEKDRLLESSQNTFNRLDVSTNTESELKGKLPGESLECDSSIEIEKLNKQVSLLLSENSNLKVNTGSLEKHNFELNEKLEKKSSELEELNFQLELLIISIKQGVRQKTSGTPKKCEKTLQENLTLIKNLLDDLIIKCNNNAIKTKTLESTLEDLIAQKEAAQYEFQQIKELNQFLEDEASELRVELEQLKSNQKFTDVVYERGIKGSSELYSIDEMDEKPFQEDKAEHSDTITEPLPVVSLENPEIHSNDFSVQVNIQNLDSYKNQLELPVEEEKISDEQKASIENSQKVEFETTIKRLTSEISDLKSCLEDKSNLVEKIHCQLDSHLEKIESLNSELKEREDDFKNSQNVVATLQEQIHLYEEDSISLKNNLRKAKSLIHELNAEKNKLNSSILALRTLSEEEISFIRNNLSSTINEYDKSFNLNFEKSLHLENIHCYVKSKLISASKDIESWLKSMQVLNNSDLSAISNFMQLLESNAEDENVNEISVENRCSNNCCSLAADIDNLKNINQEFSSLLCNYLKTSVKNSMDELNECKVNVIPTLKATIADMENQLQEYLNKNVSMTDSMSEQKLEVTTCETADEDLKTQLADKELKMNKFKQIALKMKKELMECKKLNNELSVEKEKYMSQLKEAQREIENLSMEQLQYVQNYQSLQNEYDKIQDELELHKENSKKLEGDFSSTLQELTNFKEKVTELEMQLQKSKQILDATTLAKKETEQLYVDLESKLIVAESKIQEKALKVDELESTIKDKVNNINVVTEENFNLKQQLEISQKEEKKKNLMDLEMADYERSVEELNNIIQKKDDEISELKIKLSCELEKNEGLLEEIKSTETLKETEEKRVMNLKAVLEKTKSELSSIKEREEELTTTVSSLKMQLEILVQQEENCKLQISETASEVQHLREMLKTSSENHQRIVRSFESKIATQKQEILLSHKEVESIKQEFENYKIRVHSVLKQQKSSTPAFTSVEEDLTEKLESVIEKLKLQVKELNEKLTAVSLEYEGLQEEHDVLLQRYNKALSDREKEENEWHLRIQKLNAEKAKLRAAQEELSSQHLLQNEMLVSTYKKQIKIMSEEHKRTVSELQKQVESADLEIARLQRDQQKAHGLPVTPTMQESMSFDILSQERQEGEGSESIDDSDTPVRQFSLSTIPSSGFLPLEKLLQSSLEDNTARNSIQYQDCEKLISDLSASNKQIEHLSEVLNESESANLRLSEQVRVLKEEVRRLERNKEREEHAENLEYLKNVFIKFSTLNACSEKAMLIPVLTTMLKLSPSEQQELKVIAGEIDPNEAVNSGWGSYLHRWSGLG